MSTRPLQASILDIVKRTAKAVLPGYLGGLYRLHVHENSSLRLDAGKVPGAILPSQVSEFVRGAPSARFDY